MSNVVAWMTANLPIVIAIAIGLVSEVLSIMQLLKYPTNSGAGGILASILKVLQGMGGSNPPALK